MRTLLLLFVLLATGCAPVQEPSVPLTTDKAFPLPLPVVYTADLPLTSCPPLSFALTLRPDGLYFLRVNHIAPGDWDIRTEAGAWQYTADLGIVRLKGYDDASRTLAVSPGQRLRVLEASGGIMPPYVRYEFVPTTLAPTATDEVLMRGMYRCLPEGGQFRECLSGASFPVVRAGEYNKLEQACAEVLHGQDQPVFVALQAQLSPGYGGKEYLIPTRFIDLDPSVTCEGGENHILTLVDSRWRLVEVNGRKPEPGTISESVFLAVQARDNQFRGFAGCNNFFGAWQLKGRGVVFRREESTRMACSGGMGLEDAFLDALDRARGYRIRDGRLSLLDQAGKVLARLRYTGRAIDLDWQRILTETGEDDAVSVEVGGDLAGEDAEPPEDGFVYPGTLTPLSLPAAPEQEVIPVDQTGGESEPQEVPDQAQPPEQVTPMQEEQAEETAWPVPIPSEQAQGQDRVESEETIEEDMNEYPSEDDLLELDEGLEELEEDSEQEILSPEEEKEELLEIGPVESTSTR